MTLPIDMNLFKDTLAQWESSDNYNTRNRLGYLGRYQMGAPALIDAGLVKPGTTNRGLRNPANWLKGSMDKFLKNPALQDKAFETYSKKNYQYLLSNGLINEDSSKADIAGVMAAAHLVGAGGARDALLGGKDVRDANGMKPQTYMQKMRSVFGATSTAPTQQTKQTVPQQQVAQQAPEGSGLSLGSGEGFNVQSLVNPWLQKAKRFYGFGE